MRPPVGLSDGPDLVADAARAYARRHRLDYLSALAIVLARWPLAERRNPVRLAREGAPQALPAAVSYVLTTEGV